MVLFNHSAKNFVVKAGDRIAQLILERIKTLQVENVAGLDDTDHGAIGFGCTSMQSTRLSHQQISKRV